ncbi:MAG: 3'-5' exonuclease [Flavobacteriales bacterium]|nr:3'-5' exonuclease [Flavobacteriales bacterium]|tara:strand:- start:4734 stop:5327 length:594 start_codon:yes stop_codon:yes gene_type:complete
MAFKKYVPKDEIKNYSVEKFNGKTSVIDKKKDLLDAYLFLKKQKIIGFDTESRPTFKKGVSSNVSLIQFSTKNEVFLFRINLIGFDDKLIDIINDKKIKKIGIAIFDDIKSLQKIKEFESNSVIDLNKLALNLGFESIGAVKLSILILGFSISKSARLSNWEKKDLTTSQIEYAATDAWICNMIYKKLLNEGEIKDT